MNSPVIGCGYLGTTHEAAPSPRGHVVTAVDTDEGRVHQLTHRGVPFFEPGLARLLDAGLQSGTLMFTSSFADGADRDVHFLRLGTPQQETTHHADPAHVVSAVEALTPHLHEGSVLVGRSTVPAGTCAALLSRGIARLVTGFTTAELARSAADAFLALKLFHMNGSADVRDSPSIDMALRLAESGAEVTISASTAV